MSGLDTAPTKERPVVDVDRLLPNLASGEDLENNDPKQYEEAVPFEALQQGVDYVVLQSGQTLTTIANAHPEITVEQIRQWNPKAAANTRKLPSGTRILISGSAQNMGERINTMGRVMGAEGQDMSLYQTASTSTPSSTVRYGASVYIEKTDTSNTWYYVSVDGNKGWIERVYITTNIPISDPEAELYYVTSGQTLEGILKEKGYPSSKETSYWHYGRAASLLNPTAFTFDGQKAQQFIQEQRGSARGVSKLLIDEEIGLQLLYNSIGLQPTYHIWLPSINYTEQAKASGAIESRSDLMQGVIDVAEGVESFLQGARAGFTGRIEEELSALKEMLEQLAAFAKDILGSVHSILMDFWNYIQQFSIEKLLQELLEGLVDPTLKMHINNAWNSLNSGDTEEQAKLWGLAAGAAVALGAILVITRGGGKLLKVLKKISPNLGGLLNKKQLAMELPGMGKMNVDSKDFSDGKKDNSISRMDGKDGGGFDDKKNKKGDQSKKRLEGFSNLDKKLDALDEKSKARFLEEFDDKDFAKFDKNTDLVSRWKELDDLTVSGDNTFAQIKKDPDFLQRFDDIAKNNKLNDHIFRGELKRDDKGNIRDVAGVHSNENLLSEDSNITPTQGDIRIKPNSKIDLDKEYYKGKIQVYGKNYESDGTPIDAWRKPKRSTFFPDSWSREKIQAEIALGIKNQTTDPLFPVSNSNIAYKAVMSDGTKLQLLYDSSNNLISAFPNLD